MDFTQLPPYAYVLIVIVLVAAGAPVVLKLLRGGDDDDAGAGEEHPQDRDARIPMRRFAHGVIVMLTGGDDYGYAESPEDPASMLESSGMPDAESVRSEVRARIDSTDDPQEDEVFSAILAIHYARAGAGALYLSQEESWALVAEAIAKLQRLCSSWQEVMEIHRAVTTRYAEQHGIDYEGEYERRYEWAQRELWPHIPFRQALH